MIIGSNRVMERSNLVSRFTNEDHDGDSLIALALHSTQAREDFKYAYVKNLVEFEHMDELLVDLEHEAIYSAYMLTLKAQENINVNDEERSLKTEYFSMEEFKAEHGLAFYYPEFGIHLTRVEAAINYVLLKEVYTKCEDKVVLLYRLEDGLLTKKKLYVLINKVWQLIQKINQQHESNIINFYDVIHEFDKFLLECSAVLNFCIPSFDLEDFVVQNDEIDQYKTNLISVEPFLAFHQNLILFEKVSQEIQKNKNNILNLVYQSGARLKSVQLLKAASNTGIPTDIYGKAFPYNIKNSLLDGLTPEEYFITGDSARLALAQRQEAIPKGGEMQRKLFFSIGITKLDKEMDDCGNDKYYNIFIKNKAHLKLMNHRWYLGESNEEVQVDINDISLVGQTLKFRSPVTCKCPDYKVCKKCFGTKLPESVNLGSLVGSALSEGIIQSVLRTHHFGGAFIATENYELLDILRRSTFHAPDTITSTPEDIDYIIEYLNGIYKEEDWQYKTLTYADGKKSIEIKINETPFHDDSTKALSRITNLFDKNREESNLIDPSELYNQLSTVIEQNGILSVYLELIISLLYYDDEGVLYRYTDKEPTTQVALKNIVEVLDPKLSIFYNFSNRIISKIYNKDVVGHVDHMYHDLLDVYE